MSSPVIQTEKANLELMSGKSMLHILKDVTLQVNSGEVTAVDRASGQLTVASTTSEPRRRSAARARC